MLKNILMVGIGGGAGSILRYSISLAMLPVVNSTGFPLATLTVNVAGSFLIGIFMSMAGSSPVYSLLVAGFCGGFTTFSAFSLETVEMIRTGNNSAAILYIAVSVLLTLAAVWAGIKIVN